MAPLFWMLMWISQVLPGMSERPRPFNLNLSSIDFIHQLTWEPGPGTANVVNYSISVHSLKETSWESVAGCENVQHPLVCNLTMAFSNPRTAYFIKVTAHLGAGTLTETSLKPFQPIRDTHLDPPLLSVTSCGRNLCVDLHPPLEHLRDIYDSFQYKLQITSYSTDGALLQFKEEDARSMKGRIVNNLAQDRKYCISVKFSDIHVPRHSNYSQPKCTVIPGVSQTEPWLIVLLSLLPLFSGVVLVLLVITGVIPLKQNPLPRVLSSIRHFEERLFFPHSSALSSLFIIEPTAPSSETKTTRRAGTDGSDADSLMESTGGGRKGYELRLGTNVAVASSSLVPSSLTSPLDCELGLDSNSSSQQNPVFLESDASSGSDCRSSHLRLQTETMEGEPTPSAPLLQDSQGASEPRPTAEGPTPEAGQEEVVTKGRNQDVNLNTLTFGGHEEDKEHSDMPGVTSPSHLDLEVSVDTSACGISEQTDEEEEEEESSGYMSRPLTHSLQNMM